MLCRRARQPAPQSIRSLQKQSASMLLQHFCYATVLNGQELQTSSQASALTGQITVATGSPLVTTIGTGTLNRLGARVTTLPLFARLHSTNQQTFRSMQLLISHWHTEKGIKAGLKFYWLLTSLTLVVLHSFTAAESAVSLVVQSGQTSKVIVKSGAAGGETCWSPWLPSDLASCCRFSHCPISSSRSVGQDQVEADWQF